MENTTVELGGRTFDVLPTLLRDVEKITPMLKEALDAVRTQGVMLDGAAITRITEIVYLGIKRGVKDVGEFTVESLRDLPVTVEELVKALETVLRHGLRLRMRAPGEGEAQGTETPRT